MSSTISRACAWSRTSPTSIATTGCSRAYFKGITDLPPDLLVQIPEDWLRRQAELLLTEEEKELIQALGGWDKLMETLRQRLRGAEMAAIKAARNGSARRAPRRSAPTATTRRACASVRKARATGVR